MKQTGTGNMPRISEFHGIVITMNFRDHAPPHFHAEYGEHEASFDIESLGTCAGWLPPRQCGRVVEWAAMHLPELRQNWTKSQNLQPLDWIEPLP